MYFPFLYGRRSEFVALRGMLNDHRSLDALLPVLEPVKRNPKELGNCLTAFHKKGQPLAVIINPDKYELKQPAELKAWYKELRPILDANGTAIPVYRCTSTTPAAHLTAFEKQFPGRHLALAYSSPSLSDTELKELAANNAFRFHLVLNDKMTASQQALLPKSKRVGIKDYFNKLDRNADYNGTELFTDRHKNFNKDSVGFGDFASIGVAFNVGGTTPAAIAIHAVYKHNTGDAWIEHFVSDDTDIAVGSPASKFLQAAKKLGGAVKKRPNEFGSNFALDAYAQCVANNHYPSLGPNKTLQIQHHVCFMLDLLSGAV